MERFRQSAGRGCPASAGFLIPFRCRHVARDAARCRFSREPLRSTSLLPLGESESRQGPTGTDMLTSAFAESTRAPRPAAAAYPGPDGGRLLAVDSERPTQAAEMTKASAGVVEAGVRMRGKRITPVAGDARVLAVETNRPVTRRSSLTPRGRRSGGFSGSSLALCRGFAPQQARRRFWTAPPSSTLRLSCSVLGERDWSRACWAAGPGREQARRVVAPVAQQARAMPHRSLWRWRFVSARVRANESLAGGAERKCHGHVRVRLVRRLSRVCGLRQGDGHPRTVGRAG
jgi:hypothetical protein